MHKPEGHDQALIVFARYPKPGAVKTRLAAGVGPDLAVRLYRLLVSKILKEALRLC